VTWHFRCQTAAAGPLYNHVAVMALTDLLATRVVDLAGAKRRKRLSAIEALHDAMEEI
jgi:DNA-binding MurR/RpiR family transcriptional regulator